MALLRASKGVLSKGLLPSWTKRVYSTHEARHEALFTEFEPLLDPEQVMHGELSERLKKSYLAPWGGEVAWPLRGVIYGSQGRVYVSAGVSVLTKPPITIHFIVDTGAPRNYISMGALDALGIFGRKEWVNLSIHGVKMSAFIPPTHSNAFGYNILGFDFFVNTYAKLIVDYKLQECIVERQD